MSKNGILPEGVYVGVQGDSFVISNSPQATAIRNLDALDRQYVPPIQNGILIYGHFDEGTRIDGVNSRISYVAYDEGVEIFGARVSEYKNGICSGGCRITPSDKRTALRSINGFLIGNGAEGDIIDNLTRVFESSKGDLDEKRLHQCQTLFDDFYTLLKHFGKVDTREMEALKAKIAELEGVVGQLGQQNAEKDGQINAISSENEELATRLETANRQFKQVRKFITERCSKIPFFGRRILDAMNKSLQEARSEASGLNPAKNDEGR